MSHQSLVTPVWIAYTMYNTNIWRFQPGPSHQSLVIRSSLIQSLVTSHQSLVTSYTSYQLLVISYQLLVTSQVWPLVKISFHITCPCLRSALRPQAGSVASKEMKCHMASCCEKSKQYLFSWNREYVHGEMFNNSMLVFMFMFDRITSLDQSLQNSRIWLLAARQPWTQLIYVSIESKSIAYAATGDGPRRAVWCSAWYHDLSAPKGNKRQRKISP